MQAKTLIVIAVLFVLGMFLWALHGRYYMVSARVFDISVVYEIDRWTGQTWQHSGPRKKLVVWESGEPFSFVATIRRLADIGIGRWTVDWLGVLYFALGVSVGVVITSAPRAWKQSRKKRRAPAIAVPPTAGQ